MSEVEYLQPQEEKLCKKCKISLAPVTFYYDTNTEVWQCNKCNEVYIVDLGEYRSQQQEKLENWKKFHPGAEIELRRVWCEQMERHTKPPDLAFVHRGLCPISAQFQGVKLIPCDYIFDGTGKGHSIVWAYTRKDKKE